MAWPRETRPQERVLVGVPAVRRMFPHGIGYDAARDYMRLRDQAWDAVTAGDAASALHIAVRCLEEAARMAHRATSDLTDAMRQADDAVSLQAALTAQQRNLDAEYARFQGEKQQSERERQTLEAERQELRAALEAAEARLLQAPPGPSRRKGTRAAHRQPPESVLPDHNATLRPDPAAAGGPAQFMQLLREFRIWAGNPSYRDMAARDQRFTSSALHAALKRDALPRRHEMVDAIVAGCGGSDEDRGMWATAWRRLAMHPASGVPLAQAAPLPEESEPA